MKTTTGTTGNIIDCEFKLNSPGVLMETERLTYWRRSTPHTLTSENMAHLEADEQSMLVTLDVETVREESYMCRAEAGFCIQDAVAADDWMAEESRSRDYDYRALVALARAKMLEELAKRLEAEGKHRARLPV